MSTLLKADCYKMFRQRSFYICLIVCVILAVIQVFSVDYSSTILLSMSAADPSMAEIAAPYTTLSASAQLKGTFSLNGILFAAIFIPLFVSSEFRSGTVKNTLAKGFSRTQYFFSKWIVSLIFSIVVVLLYSAAATVTGTFLWGFGSVDAGYYSDIVQFVLLQILVNAAFASLFLMFSFLIRSTGGAIALNVCVLQFASLAVSLIEMLLYWCTGQDFPITNGWLATNVTQLITDPLTTTLAMQAIIVSLAYLLVCTGIGLVSFVKRDVK